jgi:hypothetical protein
MDYNKKPTVREEKNTKTKNFFKQVGLIALAFVLSALTVLIISLNK